MSSDNDDGDSDGTDNTGFDTHTPLTAQQIVFDCRQKNGVPIKGVLQTFSEEQTNSTCIVKLSSSEIETLFGKRNAYSNNLLRFAEIVFITDGTQKDHRRLLFSDRKTRYGTNFSEEEVVIEDANDLHVLHLAPGATIHDALTAAKIYYRQNNVHIFHESMKVCPHQTVDLLKPQTVFVNFVIERQLQIKIEYHVEYNIKEILFVECFNTDSVSELKRKLIEQFPTKNFKDEEMRFTFGDRELSESEPILTTLSCDRDFRCTPGSPSYDQREDLTLHCAPQSYVKVLVQSGKSVDQIPVFINRTWSTCEIRNTVANRIQCYPQSICLLYNNNEIPEMSNTRKLIQENVVLKICVREKIKIHITVQEQSSLKTFVIFMYDVNTTDDLKLALLSQLEIDPFLLDIYHGRDMLNASTTFKNLGFRRNEELIVVVQRQRLPIRVSCLQGRRCRIYRMIIDDPATVTVRKLLEFWAIYLVCEESDLRVIFNNRCLNPNLNLCEAQVQHGSLLFIRKCNAALVTIPGVVEKVVMVGEHGNELRDAICKEGMTFYANPDMNYQSNISMLKRRRYEERRLRKFPTGMRLEDAKNHSPLPSPLKVPFQCCESDDNTYQPNTPTIHGSEYLLATKQTQSKGCTHQDQLQNVSDKSDVLSCKTFPVSRRDKRKSSNTLCENSASKKLKMDGKSLPDFGQLLEAKDKTTESVEVPKPKGTVQSDGPGKQVHRTISLPSSLQLDHVDHKNYKIVKQSSETTQIYASPETSSIIRRQIRKDDEIISSHQIARLHKTPVLKEIEGTMDSSSVRSIASSTSISSRVLPDVILQNVAKKAFSSWKILARELEVPESAIGETDAKHNGDVVEKCYQILLKWRQKEGSQVTVKALRTALVNIDNREAADELSMLFSRVQKE